MKPEALIYQEKRRGLAVNVYYDLEPPDPREWDNLGHLFCKHSRYNLGDDHELGIEDLNEIVAQPDIVFLPVYLMDHSGLAMNTVGFHCPWDSGQVGYTFVSKEKIRQEYGVKRISQKLMKKVYEVLQDEVSTYNKYLQGDCYGYAVEDGSGEILDSCWGYYDYDYCLKEAKSMADYHAEKLKEEAAAVHALERGESCGMCGYL